MQGKQEQEMVKNEQSKIGSMDWDSDDAYRLAKIAMAEAESEDTEGKPNGLSGSSLIFLRTSFVGVPDFLLVLKITSTPSGILSE